MTDPEFATWFQHHIALFPDVMGMLGRNSGKEGQPSQRQIRNAWQRLLECLTLAEATAASDAMFAGDDTYRRLEDHPRAVRRIALARTERRTKGPPRHYMRDGEMVYDCHVCRDEGRVSVYSDVAIDWARIEIGWRVEPLPRYAKPAMTFSLYNGPYRDLVICSCKHGDRLARARKNPVRYSAERFCRIDLDQLPEDSWKELVAWCGEYANLPEGATPFTG